MTRRSARIKRLAACVLPLTVAYFAWWGFTADHRPALDDPALARQLADLGYADWVDIPGGARAPRGVTQHDPARAHPGLNLYCSHARSGALLVDMRGDVIDRWLVPGIDARWHHVEMTPEGDLLVIVNVDGDPFLMALDWDSTVLWKRPFAAHHDIALTKTGEIHTLTSRVIEIPFGKSEIPIIDNSIVAFSPGSKRMRETSLFELFGDRIPQWRFAKVHMRTRQLGNRIRRLFGKIELKRERMDLLHANSIQILDRSIEGLGAAGDALIAIRELDQIAVVDEANRRVVWTWGPGEIERPHHPTLLEDGNILIFDNGSKRRYSRVIELEPRSRAITWQYVAEIYRMTRLEPSFLEAARSRGSRRARAGR